MLRICHLLDNTDDGDISTTKRSTANIFCLRILKQYNILCTKCLFDANVYFIYSASLNYAAHAYYIKNEINRLLLHSKWPQTQVCDNCLVFVLYKKKSPGKARATCLCSLLYQQDLSVLVGYQSIMWVTLDCLSYDTCSHPIAFTYCALGKIYDKDTHTGKSSPQICVAV